MHSDPEAVELDQRLDEALEETFPASDPIAIHAEDTPVDPPAADRAPDENQASRSSARP